MKSPAKTTPSKRDRVLVTADHHRISEFLRAHYPQLEVVAVDTYMQAVWNAAQRPPRAVIGSIDPTFGNLPHAVEALRQAAGDRTRLLLCCSPEAEPAARAAAACGADGYLIAPLSVDELDASLDYGRPAATAPSTAAELTPTVSMSELHGLAELLARLEDEPLEFLNRLAAWVCHAFSATWAECVVEGVIGRAGTAHGPGVISEPMKLSSATLGTLSLGPRSRSAYGISDTLKLRHMAVLSAQLIDASRRTRNCRQLSQVDEVSELPNRRKLLSFLDEVLARAQRERFAVTVLLFDIDNFKQFNDEYGHNVGDEIIRLIGRLFRSCCREQDLVTRYGGDEFAVVFWDAGQPRVPGSRHPTDALAVLRRFETALAKGMGESEQELPATPLTISGGLASFPWDGTTPEDLITQADRALLKAKKSGKNRIYIISDEELDAPEPEAEPS